MLSPTINLTDMISTLLERRPFNRKEQDKRPAAEICAELLSQASDVSNFQLANALLNRYERLDTAGKLEFFNYLNDELDVDGAAIAKIAKSYASQPTPEKYRALCATTEAPRLELLRRLNQVPGATAELVKMRVELLQAMKSTPGLARLDLDFVHLLRSWFNRGFLVMRQITWESPASILEKIIEYEAVHEIHTWDDLRSRLQPSDRHCFAFFHPAMPDEPLIFVEVALVNGIPTSIPEVLTDKRELIDEQTADTAVFYSISNCQKGLAGISFGNSLIKQVVRYLSAELPNIKQFVTLSPIPGLSKWIKQNDLTAVALDQTILKRLTAHYLIAEKNTQGSPLDPVARFHLANGALVHAVNVDADISDKGMAQSNGAMVNYLYDLNRISQNLARYAAEKEVNATSSVNSLARHAKKNLPEAPAETA